MPAVKIAHFRLAQDRAGGFVSLSLMDVGGNPGPFGPWKPVPFSAFASLVSLLTAGPCVYDSTKDMYASDGNRHVRDLLETATADKSFVLPVRSRKKSLSSRKKSTPKKKSKNRKS